MSYIAIMLLSVLNTINPTPAQETTHVRTSVTRTPQPSDGHTILHNNPHFRTVRAWCEENPGQCVRVGNTYIVQGR